MMDEGGGEAPAQGSATVKGLILKGLKGPGKSLPNLKTS